MASLNKSRPRNTQRTHNGAVVVPTNAKEQLTRAVLTCLLWEDTYYESGKSIADRISTLAKQCPADFVGELAAQARNDFKLRHAPLWLTQGLIEGGNITAKSLEKVLRRPDELTEFMAMYWKDGRKMVPRQVKKAMNARLNSFDEYQLSKYYREDKAVTLRDVMFMTRPKPKNAEQAAIFKRLADKKLKTADTWETRLSEAGKADTKEEVQLGKKEAMEDLLNRGKMGHMAILRNLRKMNELDIDHSLIFKALRKGAGKSMVLPFRYLSAAKHAVWAESVLDECMMKSFEGLPKLSGKTAVLVDVSGSMQTKLSEKSEVNYMEAGAALAIYAREAGGDHCRTFAFGSICKEVAARRGMALKDAICKANSGRGYGYGINDLDGGVGHGTNIGSAVQYVVSQMKDVDRIIVVTDAQSTDRIPALTDGMQGYIVNVAPYQNGVGYEQGWTTITGWSEHVFRFIEEVEKIT